MKCLFVCFLCFHAIYAVTHSWKAFYTGSTGLKTLPEFVALNLLDDEVMGYFDSRTNVFESKQSWVVENLGQQYVEQQTNVLRGHTQSFKANVAIAMQRFNQTKGVHMFQNMYGCEWDDETNKVVGGFYQFGFDGEDFISFDLNTGTWIAPKQQAVITKHKLDQDKALTAQMNHYLTQHCPEWLKKYVKYGSSSLMRTELPLVSLLQKSPSSAVSCHATGFYPDRASLFWRKDGEELHEDVDQGEILRNHDGTFQMSVDLKLSSVPAEDRKKYECVFQLSGVEKDIVTQLHGAEIRTNAEKPMTIIIIGAVLGGLVAVILVILTVVGVIKKCKAKNAEKNVMTPLNPPPPMSDSGSDSSSTEGVNSSTKLM
ncbi:major histocompatibility complex class I-related gene protein [Clinocottus analis]|uniref:major histocompatibility complex class I-related gene protein n=1 Tax=Clinocottus analis TaxID=304258 RepID=UPI0035C10791